MERIALGESVVIRRRNQPIAVLQPVASNQNSGPKPDFRKRLRAIYGDQVLPQTATELLSDERGER